MNKNLLILLIQINNLQMTNNTKICHCRFVAFVLVLVRVNLRVHCAIFNHKILTFSL